MINNISYSDRDNHVTAIITRRKRIAEVGENHYLVGRELDGSNDDA